MICPPGYLGVLPAPAKRFEPAFYSESEQKAAVAAIPGIDPATGEVRAGLLLRVVLHGRQILRGLGG